MIIVTGGAGFVGSNLVKRLNALGYNNIVVVDNLQQGIKYRNILDCEIADYLDIKDFLDKIQKRTTFSDVIDVIFHQGACADTTEWDGRFMLNNNYEYSKLLLHYCDEKRIPFIYASSAAIYGNGQQGFREHPACEKPLNIYGYSKYLFDQYVRRFFAQAKSPIVGLRYFNVYGPREQHKGTMASVALHFCQELLEHGIVKLFAGSDGYADGEQRRDFIYIDDIINIIIWFWQNQKSGIYNAGTGRSQTFNDVANAVITWHGSGKIQYTPFPENLRGAYQSFTQADISQLRQVGYPQPFKTVEEGITLYLDWLEENKKIYDSCKNV